MKLVMPIYWTVGLVTTTWIGYLATYDDEDYGIEHADTND